MILLVLTLLGGSEVHLNPAEIIALVEARDADNPLKKYAADVRCVVIMSGGQQYTTREECQSIERRLKAIRERQP